MADLQRGRLRDPSEAPRVGEHAEPLAAFGPVEIIQILSGRLDEAVDFVQAEDEWVLVLGGRGRLELDGRDVVLEAGDWLYLPAGVPHRLVEAEPGTSWLAVHVERPDAAE
ncbi:MAG TPA: cupin domain-containing protein [Gaiellaceae bacterium]|jgi:cupin 2 domain-containing protein